MKKTYKGINSFLQSLVRDYICGRRFSNKEHFLQLNSSRVLSLLIFSADQTSR